MRVSKLENVHVWLVSLKAQTMRQVVLETFDFIYTIYNS